MNGTANTKLVGLDSNVFIYQFEDNPLFCQYTSKIFEKLASNKLQAVTSIISLIESLSFPSPAEVRTKIEEGFTMPNLTVLELNHGIGLTTARLRRDYGLHLGDAIQLASALSAKAKVFITNDAKLKRFKELKVMLLNEI